MSVFGSEEYQDPKCDPCSGRGTSQAAVKYCPVCDEFLCQGCVRDHLRNKVLGRHPLDDNLTVSFKRTEIHPVELCDKHKTERIEHFCDTHNVVCCTKCKFVAHRGCTITDLKNKSKTENQPKLINDTLQLIQTLQQTVQRIKATQDKGLQSLKINKVKCFTEIKTIKKELDDLFIKLEKEVLDEVVEIETIIRSQLDNQIAESKHFLQQLDDCKSMLEDCQSTQDDAIMFIGIDKSRDDIDKMAKLVSELQDDTISTDLQFEAHQNVNAMRKTIKRLGNVKSGKSIRHTAHAQATGSTVRVSGTNVASHPTSDDTSGTSRENTVRAAGEKYTANLLGVTVSSQRVLDVNSTIITGSTFLESGELVLCDYQNNKLLILSQDLTLKGELQMSGQPFDVAAITECRVAVTTPFGGDQLIFVDTTPTMTVTNKIKLKSNMQGIVSRSQLYVLVNCGLDVYGGRGQHEILVVSHDGRQVRTINLSAVGIKCPYYIAVNRDESRVFVSDSNYAGTNSVSCIECQSGTELFRFRSKELEGPRGLFVGDNNVLMICWVGSGCITVVTAEGRHERTLLSHKDGLYDPHTVTYRPRDGTLVVGMWPKDTSPACRVFRLKSK